MDTALVRTAMLRRAGMSKTAHGGPVGLVPKPDAPTARQTPKPVRPAPAKSGTAAPRSGGSPSGGTGGFGGIGGLAMLGLPLLGLLGGRNRGGDSSTNRQPTQTNTVAMWMPRYAGQTGATPAAPRVGV